MASINERIFAAVIARLELIQVANGYHTDAGLKVFRARRSLGKTDLPCVVVWDSGEEPVGESGNGNSRSITVLQRIGVEVHAAADRDETGEVLGLLKEDAKRALLIYDGLADDDGKLGVVEYEGAEPIPREDGGVSEAIRLNTAMKYPEARGNPAAVA